MCLVCYCWSANTPSRISSLWASVHQGFASFFTYKSQKFRQAVSASISDTGYVLSLYPPKIISNTITQFNLINHKNIEDIIQHLKPSSCCCVILPKGFFKNVLNYTTSERLQIANTTLLSGVLPKALKTAVIKPLLKENNLDPSLLNNYRPISTLLFL